MADLKVTNRIDPFKNHKKSELLDLLVRQERLLANTKFIAKLPDQGEKIRSQKARLETALAQHDDVDDAARLFQRLKLGKPKVQDSQDPDSDDDVSSPPADNDRILGEGPLGRNEPASNASESSLGLELYVAKLTQHLEPENGRPAHLLYHFRANREIHSTKSADLVSSATRTVKPKRFYETAVTPPPATFNEAQLIPLKDSYKLAKKHEETLKELAMIQATELLALGSHAVVDAGFLETNYTQYRNVVEEPSSDED